MSEKRTILLVDDDGDIRTLYTLVLESAGYAVIAVAHALEALNILATSQVALLITDYHMPEMNGAALIANVRASYPHLPIILASSQRGLATLAAYCGANGCYEKGTSLTQLLDLVRVYPKNISFC
jgi:CheY-like chemotaxis protein